MLESGERPASATSWRAYVEIARPDHWVKNALAVPGTIAALAIGHAPVTPGFLWRCLVGLLSNSSTTFGIGRSGCSNPT
jgi:hypothetical protein